MEKPPGAPLTAATVSGPGSDNANTTKIHIPLSRYSTWIDENQLKRWAPALAVLVTGLIRWCVGLGPYSGYATPPRFGDYEAQRHWMELTLHQPVGLWYWYTDNWWGLDYPPLSAYTSWLVGYIGNMINPEWYAWKTSRGFESPEAKEFMRISVLLFELAVYTTSVFVFTRRWLVNKSWTRQHTLLLLVLLQPGLILIDHGHFQYNAVMLGLTVWAVDCYLGDQDVLGSVFFCLALSFKQMALYFSPAVFGYLLGKSLRQGFIGCIWKLIKLGVTVLATLGIMFAPWLQSKEDILQVAQRIFPVFRGLYEDKVANIWCALNVVVKLRDLFDIQTLVRFSTLATLVAFLPSCVALIARPTKRGLVYGLVNCSLSFFLLSFQVHEKSILLPALPVTLLVLDEPVVAPWFMTLACFSMYPLLYREGLVVPYLAVVGLWVWLTAGLWTRRVPSAVKWLAMVAHVGLASLHIAELVVPTPLARYPDLYAVLNAVLSAGGFTVFWVYFNWRQLVWLPSVAVSSSSSPSSSLSSATRKQVLHQQRTKVKVA
ncbi:Glucosyltransferase-like protein [Actinomortierella ambigua]|nr:Glucosyltransferase-like protein [Actinomortierella ambigua]